MYHPIYASQCSSLCWVDENDPSLLHSSIPTTSFLHLRIPFGMWRRFHGRTLQHYYCSCAQSYSFLLLIRKSLVLKEVLYAFHNVVVIFHHLLPKSWISAFPDSAWLVVTCCRRMKIIVSTLLFCCTNNSMSSQNPQACQAYIDNWHSNKICLLSSCHTYHCIQHNLMDN